MVFHACREGVITWGSISHCQPLPPGYDLPNDEVVIGVAEKVSAASQPGSVTIYSNLFHRQPVAENFTTLAYQQDDSIPTHPLKRERSNAEKCLPPKRFKKPKKSLRTCFNPTAKTQKAGNFFLNSILSQSKEQVYMLCFLPKLKVSLTLSSNWYTWMIRKPRGQCWVAKPCRFSLGQSVEIPYFPLTSPETRTFQKTRRWGFFYRFHASRINYSSAQKLNYHDGNPNEHLRASMSAWDVLVHPMQTFVESVGIPCKFHFLFMWLFMEAKRLKSNLPLSSISGKQEPIRSFSFQWCLGFVITEQEKHLMGLLRNDFLLSCTLWKLFSSLLHPRRVSISYPLFPIYHILQTEVIKGTIIYFWLSKLTARLTRNMYSKFILSRNDALMV